MSAAANVATRPRRKPVDRCSRTRAPGAVLLSATTCILPHYHPACDPEPSTVRGLAVATCENRSFGTNHLTSFIEYG